VLGADGTVTSKCVAEQSASQCPRVPNVAAKPSSASQKVPPNSPAVISAASSDNTPIASLAIPSDAAPGVTFSVAPVADSVYQAGSFSALFSSGKLRSPLISISPDATVDTRGGGVALSIAVDVPVDSCIVATSNMKVSNSLRPTPCSLLFITIDIRRRVSQCQMIPQAMRLLNPRICRRAPDLCGTGNAFVLLSSRISRRLR
jgi:hypothetical protein